jgi:hypothetical protein
MSIIILSRCRDRVVAPSPRLSRKRSHCETSRARHDRCNGRCEDQGKGRLQGAEGRNRGLTRRPTPSSSMRRGPSSRLAALREQVAECGATGRRVEQDALQARSEQGCPVRGDGNGSPGAVCVRRSNWADMTTTMSRHMIIAEGDRFPEIAETFFKKSCYGERRPHRRPG